MTADIESAVCALRQGKIIVYPTDTVWGIGCDAADPAAVEAVYALKRRAESKALIVLVDSEQAAERCCGVTAAEMANAVAELGDAGRPTTFVVQARAGVLAPNLLAEDGTVGVRVTREAFSSELCRRFGGPIVSTSANVSGRPAASAFAEIDAEILDGADYVCVSRRADDTHSSPSRVVRLNPDGTIQILRP